MKTFRISDIEFEATELMQTLSVHDQTYFAIGYNEKGHKYIGTAHVSCAEIVDVTDIEIDDESKIILTAQKKIDKLNSDIKGKLSDGYHSFNELYEFRKVYNAAIFNEWAKSESPKYDVHKSVRHYDGEVIFGGHWFIVVAILPSGQISNHYHIDDWYLFDIPIENKAKYEFDGHNSRDVLDRLKSLI